MAPKQVPPMYTPKAVFCASDFGHVLENVTGFQRYSRFTTRRLLLYLIPDFCYKMGLDPIMFHISKEVYDMVFTLGTRQFKQIRRICEFTASLKKT